MLRGILLTALAIGLLAGLGGLAEESLFTSQTQISCGAFTTAVAFAPPIATPTPAKDRVGHCSEVDGRGFW